MTGNDDPREAILHLLAEQARLCGLMIPVAEAKRAALLVSDAEGLAPLVREMESLAARAAEAERERLAQTSRLLGGVDPVVAFDVLAARYDGAGRERLAGLRDALRAALSVLKSLNDSNAALVRQALAITRQQARLLTGGLPATYSAAGVVAEPVPLQTRQAWRA